MKNISFFLLTLISGFWVNHGYGQLNFNFITGPNSRSVEGLSTFQFQNFTGQNVTGTVMISVKESRTGIEVMSLITPQTSFGPGVSNFSKILFSKSRFIFATTVLGGLVNQTRNFPPGEYSCCFKFLSANKQGADDFENCFDVSVEPLLPVSLTSPSNEDTICLKRPILSWQPPLPFHAGTRFRLVLTEKTSENATESLIQGKPILLMDNISSTILNYPSTYPELKEGKTYCWQIAAYEKGILISKSEVWEFTIGCKESALPVPQDSYRELKLLSNGNYYIANGYLKFSFQNHYSVTKLKIEILDIEKGSAPIKNVPLITIQEGFNKIDLDLSEFGLTAGKHYILKVYPFNESPIEVRFIYKD